MVYNIPWFTANIPECTKKRGGVWSFEPKQTGCGTIRLIKPPKPHTTKTENVGVHKNGGRIPKHPKPITPSNPIYHKQLNIPAVYVQFPSRVETLGSVEQGGGGCRLGNFYWSKYRNHALYTKKRGPYLYDGFSKNHKWHREEPMNKYGRYTTRQLKLNWTKTMHLEWAQHRRKNKQLGFRFAMRDHMYTKITFKNRLAARNKIKVRNTPPQRPLLVDSICGPVQPYVDLGCSFGAMHADVGWNTKRFIFVSPPDPFIYAIRMRWITGHFRQHCAFNPIFINLNHTSRMGKKEFISSARKILAEYEW